MLHFYRQHSLYSIPGDFKLRQISKYEIYGPTTGSDDQRVTRVRKLGVQWLICWNILRRVFAVFYFLFFYFFVCNFAERLWSPAVALKFYVTCTVFNDLN